MESPKKIKESSLPQAPHYKRNTVFSVTLFLASIAALFFLMVQFHPSGLHPTLLNALRVTGILVSLGFLAFSIFSASIAGIADYRGSDKVWIVRTRPSKFQWYDWTLLLGSILLIVGLIFIYSKNPVAQNPNNVSNNKGGIFLLLPLIYLWTLIWNSPKARFDTESFRAIDSWSDDRNVTFPMPFKVFASASRVSCDCLWLLKDSADGGLGSKVAIVGNEQDLNHLSNLLIQAGVQLITDVNPQNVRRRNALIMVCIGIPHIILFMTISLMGLE